MVLPADQAVAFANRLSRQLGHGAIYVQECSRIFCKWIPPASSSGQCPGLLSLGHPSSKTRPCLTLDDWLFKGSRLPQGIHDQGGPTIVIKILVNYTTERPKLYDVMEMPYRSQWHGGQEQHRCRVRGSSARVYTRKKTFADMTDFRTQITRPRSWEAGEDTSPGKFGKVQWPMNAPRRKAGAPEPGVSGATEG